MSVAPVVIVLAAGAGRRFIASGAKTNKLDTLLHHQTVLGHVLTTVKASGLGCYVVRPAGGTAGIGESIALGVKATANAGGWLILPADLPLIRSATLRQVAQNWRINRSWCLSGSNKPGIRSDLLVNILRH